MITSDILALEIDLLTKKYGSSRYDSAYDSVYEAAKQAKIFLNRYGGKAKVHIPDKMYFDLHPDSASMSISYLLKAETSTGIIKSCCIYMYVRPEVLHYRELQKLKREAEEFLKHE